MNFYFAIAAAVIVGNTAATVIGMVCDARQMVKDGGRRRLFVYSIIGVLAIGTFLSIQQLWGQSEADRLKADSARKEKEQAVKEKLESDGRNAALTLTIGEIRSDVKTLTQEKTALETQRSADQKIAIQTQSELQNSNNELKRIVNDLRQIIVDSGNQNRLKPELSKRIDDPKPSPLFEMPTYIGYYEFPETKAIEIVQGDSSSIKVKIGNRLYLLTCARGLCEWQEIPKGKSDPKTYGIVAKAGVAKQNLPVSAVSVYDFNAYPKTAELKFDGVLMQLGSTARKEPPATVRVTRN